MTWNINGWSRDHRQLRLDIIKGENPDVLTIVETHLDNINEQSVSIGEEYTSYSHNRQTINACAPYQKGGLCIYILKILSAINTL